MGRPEKFTALREHLKKKAQEFRESGKTDYLMTFEDIEELGVALPPSAYKHRAWWANSKYNYGKVTLGRAKTPWEKSSFETKDVDMERRNLIFRYVGTFSEACRTRQEEERRSFRRHLAERNAAVNEKSHSEGPGMAEIGHSYSAGNKQPIGMPPRCRHPLFGALKGHIRLVAGTDLTEPADPEWGSRVWGDDTK